jgi:hypothetical protein
MIGDECKIAMYNIINPGGKATVYGVFPTQVATLLSTHLMLSAGMVVVLLKRKL